MKVFIVWDQGRKEHGEPTELIDVFASREAAEHYVNEDPNCYVMPEDTSIEERKVKS